MALESLGKMLIYIGVVVIVAGAVFILLAKLPWIGKLPGDIVIKRQGLTLYIPVVTMLILSVILTVVFNLIGRK